jgi:hypothetical protein
MTMRPSKLSARPGQILLHLRRDRHHSLGITPGWFLAGLGIGGSSIADKAGTFFDAK